MSKRKESMFIPKVLAVSVLAGALLTACGGGGSGSASGATVSGRLLAPAIQGVTVSTNSTSGMTGVDGSFSCNSGETVTLQIGSAVLGTLPCTATETSLLDMVAGIDAGNLVELIRQSGTARTANAADALLNRFAFLLRMDADQDISNGVSLPAGLGELPHLQSGALHFGLGHTLFLSRLEQLVGQAMRAGLYAQRPKVLTGCDCDPVLQAARLTKQLEQVSGQSFAGEVLLDELETNADGSGMSASRSYDADGQLVNVNVTPQDDTRPSILVSIGYDDAGRRNSATRVTAAGVNVRDESWIYNVSGNLLGYQDQGFDASGAVTTAYRIDREVNSQGLPVTANESDRSRVAGEAYDFSSAKTYTYNAYGEVETMIDAVTEDGVAVDKIHTYTRDESGNPITLDIVTRSETGDILDTKKHTYTYDALGNLTGGTYSYLDAAGNELEGHTAVYDYLNDTYRKQGLLRTHTRTFRVNGETAGSYRDALNYADPSPALLGKTRQYRRADDSVRRVEQLVYTRDANAYPQTVTLNTTDVASDGAQTRSSSRFTYGYDGGRLVSAAYDADADGDDEETRVLTWTSLATLGDGALYENLALLLADGDRFAINADTDALPAVLTEAGEQ